MPSRKSHAHETPPEPRRGSLRRLSSIASFHTLNLFNRRRSNNVDNSPSTTASNVSLSSTLANAPDRHKDFNQSDISSESDARDRVPPLPTLSTRRSSYICLPDDPIGGMPRSRTFSNLPLPTRAKKSATKLQQSKSHARLPSHSENAPPSRLPTPTFTTRKHSNSRLMPLDNRILPGQSSLMRSDTEPLLQRLLPRETSMPRLTAFKENISLSPIRPLSPYDENIFNASWRSGWSEDSDSGVALYSERTTSLAYQKPVATQGVATRRLSQKFESSPAYRSSRDRPPTPAKPVQRWNSQPVLVNKTNLRNSYGTEIKQTRLMSTRQAPTPPRAKSPSTEFLLNGTRARGFSNSSGHLRVVSAQASSVVDGRLQQSSGSRARAESIKLKPGAILNAQPLAWWTGRFSSFNDRYRNEELTATDLSAHSVAKSETDGIHTTEANFHRMRRAIEHLFSLCATPEAEQSFFVWQKSLGSAIGMPQLAKVVKGSEARSCALEMSLRGGEGFTPPSDPKKMKFVDRLLGRRQKMGLTAAVV
ncbi:hypothetical protein Slin15195_G091210 [Septoria linicola]|uniref:Uncharacterized protein n=1 Tax=Septoria linicola TaxID=215465 RepID=A0A9Q9EMR3_9PEZI|nr:hypothetical protein Slin15195_G091210 [Septoria linicola]